MNEIPSDVGSKCGILEEVVESGKLLGSEVVLEDGEVREIVGLWWQGLEEWVLIICCHLEEGRRGI